MKRLIAFTAVCFSLIFFATPVINASQLLFNDFQAGEQIGEDGGPKITPFGEIPFPHVNLYNFPGWEYQLIKSSDALITGINLGTSFCPPGWPHDYSTSPMSNRALVEDGMLGVANEVNNRFLHIGGPFVPMFSPSEKISVSKNIPIDRNTKYLAIEFDYLARTLDGIPGEGEDNDKAYAKVEFLNINDREVAELTIWDWSQGTPGISSPDIPGMLYSDTDGGFAPFGKLIGQDPMNPASYAPVNLQNFSKIVKIPKGAVKMILTFGLITDSDPWASCLLIDNVRISEARKK